MTKATQPAATGLAGDSSVLIENLSSTQVVRVIHSAFGEHPEDVIEPIKTTGDAILWLREIFETIAAEALSENNNYRIKRLAETGSYLAFDIGNYAGCQHENMAKRLCDEGLLPSGELHHGG